MASGNLCKNSNINRSECKELTQHLKIGKNIILMNELENDKIRKEIIYLNKIHIPNYVSDYTKQDCYKIKSIFKSIKTNKAKKRIGIKFIKKFPLTSLYVTSEKNAFGKIFDFWMEGDELRIKLEEGSFRYPKEIPIFGVSIVQ